MQKSILQFLKKSKSYVSGEEISRHLKVSRAGVWKHMQELRHAGYDIAAVPHLGYQLMSSPDKLFADELQFELNTKIIGKTIFHHDALASTMDEAFDLGLEGCPEGTVVCAETQTRGRGRLGRNWTSPKGKGIYLSIVLRPKLSPLEMSKLTLLTAVAVSAAIKDTTGITPSIKWPNDLLIHDKKLAGILTELNAEMDRVKFVVVGLGINVNSLPGHLPQGSTSLRHEGKRPFSRIEITQAIFRSFEKWYLKFLDQGFDPVIQRWRDLSVTLNKNVRIADRNGFVEGKAVNIDSDGGLLIRTDSGLIVKKMAGDVLEYE